MSNIAGVQGCSFCVAVVVVVSFGIVSLAFLAKALVAELGLPFSVAPRAIAIAFAFAAIALARAAILAKVLAFATRVVVLALVVVRHIDRAGRRGVPLATADCTSKGHRILALALVVVLMGWF